MDAMIDAMMDGWMPSCKLGVTTTTERSPWENRDRCRRSIADASIYPNPLVLRIRMRNTFSSPIRLSIHNRRVIDNSKNTKESLELL
jgi:hypothetical protein